MKTAYPSMPPPYHLILLARDVEADYSLRLRDELRAMVASLDDSVANEVELRRAVSSEDDELHTIALDKKFTNPVSAAGSGLARLLSFCREIDSGRTRSCFA